MNIKELKEIGLEQEIAEKVIEKHKSVLDGKYIPKHRFDAVNEELTQSKEKVKERDKSIKELQKFEGTNEELSAEIADLQEKLTVKDKEYALEIENIQKESAVKTALLGGKEYVPQDLDIVLGLMDMDSIKVKDDGLSGFDEQYKDLVENKPFLFKGLEDVDSSDGSPVVKPVGRTPIDNSKPEPEEGSIGAMLGKERAQQLGYK